MSEPELRVNPKEPLPPDWEKGLPFKVVLDGRVPLGKVYLYDENMIHYGGLLEEE